MQAKCGVSSIFDLDKVVIPVNVHDMHWCLAVIYIQDKTIQYYDSMGGGGGGVLNMLMQYLVDEKADKENGQTLDRSEWALVPTVAGTPQQNNGFDCGVYACLIAECVAIGQGLGGVQDQVVGFRKKHARRCIQRASLNTVGTGAAVWHWPDDVAPAAAAAAPWCCGVCANTDPYTETAGACGSCGAGKGVEGANEAMQLDEPAADEDDAEFVAAAEAAEAAAARRSRGGDSRPISDSDDERSMSSGDEGQDTQLAAAIADSLGCCSREMAESDQIAAVLASELAEDTAAEQAAYGRGFAVIDVSHDGLCFFYSVAKKLGWSAAEVLFKTVQEMWTHLDPTYVEMAVAHGDDVDTSRRQ